MVGLLEGAVLRHELTEGALFSTLSVPLLVNRKRWGAIWLCYPAQG